MVILGVILGLFAGMFLSMLACMMLGYKYDFGDTLYNATFISVLTLSVFVGGAIGFNSIRSDTESFVQQYQATQVIYYESLNDEKMSGFERMELVRMGNEANNRLAKYKVGVNKWYNFGVEPEIKEAIDGLEYIK